jgi:RNA polymerase sigma factor (sigma-70 family)
MAVVLQQLVGRLRRWAKPLAESGPTDRQLLNRFDVERDEAAFAELVRRHGPMVLGVARRVLQDAHDAEDVAQAAFLVLARKAASVCWRDSVGGWLFPVAYHLALKVRDGRQRRRAREAMLALPDAARPHSEQALQIREILDAELQRLPAHYRDVLVVCYLEGRTQTEAAAQLGWTANEVRGRLDRARQRLRRRLIRRGLALSAASAVLPALPSLAPAAPISILNLTQAALAFAGPSTAVLASVASSQILAQGVLHAMKSSILKRLFLAALALCVGVAGALSLGGPAQSEAIAAASTVRPRDSKAAAEPKSEFRKGKSFILLWMGGGPSQLDTFDTKPTHPNGDNVAEIETAVKGVKISANLPQMAKLADQFAILRAVTHEENSHARATYLMRRGRRNDSMIDYPPLPALLARELSDGKLTAPPYVRIVSGGNDDGAGFLPAEFAPLLVKDVGATTDPRLPPLEIFQKLNKDRAAAMRKGVERAFNLDEEKKALRDEYGRNAFGQGCLLARRLVERGVPVVEVTLGGWDAHNRNGELVRSQCTVLDPAWATLLRDLKDRKMLQDTVVVWMGEFGRTPKLNANDGRDHWPRCFSVVLAGGGVKGGQVVGKTSADGVTIEDGAATPAELHATICRALGVDPARENKTPAGDAVPLVEKGAKEVKQVLK